MNWAIEAKGLTKRYKQTLAVNGIDLQIPKGEIFGLLGPDGAGKTTLTQMLCSVLNPTVGEGMVAGFDIVKESERLRGKIGYMSEGFSLYGSLSVEENIDFFADLYQVPQMERQPRKEMLLKASRLDLFTSRRADDLSGGMKKKLALCCTLIYHPEIIFLDEPTTGVDPVSRRDFWNILHQYIAGGTTVFVCTPYMDEAERFHRVALMYQGKIIQMDAPYRIKQQAATQLGKDSVTLEEAFIHFIDEKGAVLQPQRQAPNQEREIAVKVDNLTKTFGSFTAVNQVSLHVHQGEIFGFLGPNGSGKSTTIRMLCGLLPATSGEMMITGINVRRSAHKIKHKIGYMSQKFSLYHDLTVGENIRFFAGAYGLNKKTYLDRKAWILEMADLKGREHLLASDLSGGWKQRLALGCATIHSPEILFLDEPTSGVDPIARRQFWSLIRYLADTGVTVFVTTHYMDEAEHCDRLAFILNSRLIAIGSPKELKQDLYAGNILEVECDRPFDAQVLLLEQGIKSSLFGNGLHVMPSSIPYSKVTQSLLCQGIKLYRHEEVMVSMEDVFVKLVERELQKEEGVMI